MSSKTSVCIRIRIAAIASIALVGCESRTYPPNVGHVQPCPSQIQASSVQTQIVSATISEPAVVSPAPSTPTVAVSPVPPTPIEKVIEQPATPTVPAMDLKTKIESIQSLRKQGVLTQEESDRLILRAVEQRRQ